MLSFKKLFKSDRCVKCKERKGSRFCLRVGKDICWKCCNKLRIDLQCSEVCKYSLKEFEQKGMFQFKAQTESFEEYISLIKASMDKWMMSEQDIFDNQVPLLMTEYPEKKDELQKYLNSVNFPDFFPVSYLYKKLKLPVRNTPVIINHETTANRFLDFSIENSWEDAVKLLAFYKEDSSVDDITEHLLKSRFHNKIRNYDILTSASTKDNNSALVHYEINKAFELTLFVIKQDSEWKVKSRIFGPPNLYHDETTICKQIAMLLQTQDLSTTFDMLKKYLEIYPDSSDLNYYQGMYQLFHNRFESAAEWFNTAMILEPSLYEAKYNLAFINQITKKPELAEKMYKELLVRNSQDVRIMNNLATIYFENNKLDDAKKYVDECLKLHPEYEVALKNLERIDKALQERN